MKKLILSMAAASLVTGAVATADVDVNVGGQGVFYYQTMDKGDKDLFSSNGARANIGLQLDADADLGNGFGMGGQVNFLGTLGLENNMVDASMQTAATGDLNAGMISKIYLTKKAGNTLIKAGRQELPKSLSPLAFSEGWNVFKNTFDAVVIINSDISDTTLVGAWVATGNGKIAGAPGLVDLGAFDTIGDKGAYMLTGNTKLIPATNLTLSYYALPIFADALWGDAKFAVPVVGIDVQAGTIMPKAGGADDTVAFGIKAGMKLGPVGLTAAYTDVNDGAAAVKNVGTGVKTPLYTQMILNQNSIALDSSTFLLKAVMGLGDGKLIAQGTMSSTGDQALTGDKTEIDVIYKFKALSMNMLAAYVYEDVDERNDDGKDFTNNVLRFWTRYNF
jgi:hypothetical protein